MTSAFRPTQLKVCFSFPTIYQRVNHSVYVFAEYYFCIEDAFKMQAMIKKILQ